MIDRRFFLLGSVAVTAGSASISPSEAASPKRWPFGFSSLSHFESRFDQAVLRLPNGHSAYPAEPVGWQDWGESILQQANPLRACISQLYAMQGALRSQFSHLNINNRPTLQAFVSNIKTYLTQLKTLLVSIAKFQLPTIDKLGAQSILQKMREVQRTAVLEQEKIRKLLTDLIRTWRRFAADALSSEAFRRFLIRVLAAVELESLDPYVGWVFALGGSCDLGEALTESSNAISRRLFSN